MKKRMRIMSQRKRIFSCPECGNSYEAYPPNDIHTRASLDDPRENASSVKKIVHDCLECKNPIEIYWYRPKLSISIG